MLNWLETKLIMKKRKNLEGKPLKIIRSHIHNEKVPDKLGHASVHSKYRDLESVFLVVGVTECQLESK